MRAELKLVPPQAGRTPFWYVRGTYRGCYVEQTTGETSKRDAAAVLAKIKNDIKCRANKPRRPVADRSFLKAVDSYIDWKGTISTNDRRSIDRLAEHFGETAVDEIDQAAIDKAAMALCPAGSPATRNRHVYTPASAILTHFGVKMAISRPSGAQGVARTYWLRPDEAKKFLEAAWQVKPRFAALCTFLLYSGCRLSEALRLEQADLDFECKVATIGFTKSGDPRGVHLTGAMIRAIRISEEHDVELRRQIDERRRPDQRPRPRPKLVTVFGFTKCALIYKLLAQVEAKSGVVMPENSAFHAFRHTYGAWMRRYGGVVRLEETGAWGTRAGAASYDHYDAPETARRADLLPGAGDIPTQPTRVASVG